LGYEQLDDSKKFSPIAKDVISQFLRGKLKLFQLEKKYLGSIQIFPGPIRPD
jgi:hypothetical protein